jgi:hypothetical protein
MQLTKVVLLNPAFMLFILALLFTVANILQANTCGDSIQMLGNCEVAGRQFGDVCNVLKAGFLLLQAVKMISWGTGKERMRARVGVATGDVSVGMLLPETSKQVIVN